MTTQHTPGPWEITDGGRDDDCLTVHVAAMLGGDIAYVRNKASAPLIAAAPELLAALKGLMFGVAGCMREDKYESARAAIAKAEGRT